MVGGEGKGRGVYMSQGIWFKSLFQTIFAFPIWKLWPLGTSNCLVRNCLHPEAPGAQIWVQLTFTGPGPLGIRACPINRQPGLREMFTLDPFQHHPWPVHPGELGHWNHPWQPPKEEGIGFIPA